MAAKPRSRPQLLGLLSNLCSAVLEAAAHEKETETPKDQAPEDKIGSARSGSIKGYSAEWYDLRHTFLTRLGEVNTDPFTIQKIAGHASR